MLQCLEGLDPAVSSHGNRVGRMARAVGAEMGLSWDELLRLELAARLHDIGKLFVPAFLVHTQGAFNRAEYRVMQRHAALGARLLAGHAETADLAQVAWHHHERWDGRGYPAHLTGSEIPRLARIVSVADAFDAVTSNRSGGNRSHAAALEEIQSGRGSQFCPEVVDAFLRVGGASISGVAS